ncbi:hypothetical protein CBF61_00530 [Lactobacillus taiwanensis]|uniref:Uncharacterized protein n=1 Tax=Lactobacillus taiwanensis TaxID=508451 RepID=A0A256LHT2_9LACO|nr:hypothetical protein [Lactobacillus taiwanensis]OYR88961.1 hypothetical protein CBF53_01245 [Lactobacillus taiwanensis]OYR93001.1 hypothetical protein CBF70_02010 [Lactobacillus taiwanensis]OYR93608.1 hypothetical protein CBF59_01285 [Lactobacillus taiwanensis]OYR97166.1 hypothetical protein CBF58_01320 [Lactobacillus taiwanensis]OYR98076.1 hypothetical protein CBF51_00605 [Lactobacillus taiwanensis]
MKTIIKYEAPSYAEQETIILYDKLTHNYRITTDIDKDVRKFIGKLDKNKDYRVGKNSKGKTTFLDGWLDVKNYSINVHKRPHFTLEQRKEMATRLLIARRKKGVDV